MSTEKKLAPPELRAAIAARMCYDKGESITEIQRAIWAAGLKFNARQLIAFTCGLSDSGQSLPERSDRL